MSRNKMTMPETFEEFVNLYKHKDKDGDDCISLLRLNRALEYYSKRINKVHYKINDIVYYMGISCKILNVLMNLKGEIHYVVRTIGNSSYDTYYNVREEELYIEVTE